MHMGKLKDPLYHLPLGKLLHHQSQPGSEKVGAGKTRQINHASYFSRILLQHCYHLQDAFGRKSRQPSDLGRETSSRMDQHSFRVTHRRHFSSLIRHQTFLFCQGHDATPVVMHRSAKRQEWVSQQIHSLILCKTHRLLLGSSWRETGKCPLQQLIIHSTFPSPCGQPCCFTDHKSSVR